MKKSNYIILCIFLILINISCESEKEKKLSDIERMELKGNIKSIKCITYNVKEKFGELVKEKITYDKYENYEIIFNDKGNQIENNSIPYGELESKTTYEYDDKGNLKETNEYSSNGDLVEKAIYIFDNEGNPTKCDIYNSDGKLQNKINWIYFGKRTKEYIKYDENGQIELKYEYEYEGEELIETKQYSSKQKVEKVHKFKYDNDGNQIEYAEFNSDGSLEKLETYVYDKNDNLIEKKIYDSKNVLENKHTYKYNSDNELIEHKNDDIDWGTFTYKYNDKGDLYAQENFNLKNENTYDLKKNYKYDKYGNWIEVTEYNGILPKTISEREIIYY